MTCKSDRLRSKIKNCIEIAIRGMMAEKLSETEMKAFLLFYDYDQGYLTIASELGLTGWEEARRMVNQGFSVLTQFCRSHPFDIDDYISFNDDEDIEDETEDLND